MASKYFDHIEVTPEAAAFVDRSFQIADQIRHVLRQKNWSQRDLAAALGKKEPEISRMLVGTHNFTLKTLTRLEVVLGTSLITTPQRVEAEQVASFTVQGALHLPDQVSHYDTSHLLMRYSELLLSKQTTINPASSGVVFQAQTQPAAPSCRAKVATAKQAAGEPAACLVKSLVSPYSDAEADTSLALAA